MKYFFCRWLALTSFMACIAKTDAQNVGVGTASPTARLEIQGVGNTTATTAMHIKNLAGNSLMQVFNNGNVGMLIAPSTGSTTLRLNSVANGNNVDFLNNGIFEGSISTNDTALVISSASNNFFCLGGCPPSNRLIIQPPTSGGIISTFSPGRVGMFTNTPQTSFHVNGNMLLGGSDVTPGAGYRLSVAGKIICEEVRVQVNAAWPDYVFEPDYPMIPLPLLEKQVMAQKYLPGIPSAAQVSLQKGVDMGDMQKQLLEKVEELYRYLFEMNNRILMLEQENKELKNRIH